MNLALMLVNTAVAKPLLHAIRRLLNIMIPTMLEKLAERENVDLSSMESLELNTVEMVGRVTKLSWVLLWDGDCPPMQFGDEDSADPAIHVI